MGQRVYFAAEENDCCTRNCCGPSRPFTIRIIDNMGQEVITLQRPLRCSACCCPCCLQEVRYSFLFLAPLKVFRDFLLCQEVRWDKVNFICNFVRICDFFFVCSFLFFEGFWKFLSWLLSPVWWNFLTFCYGLNAVYPSFREVT